MKKFIIKSIKFLFVSVFIFYSKPFYFLYNDKYQRIVKSKDVYLAIKKSFNQNNKKIIILGDSVPFNIFGEKEFENVYSLASNGAIGVIGQYLVFYNYLKSGNLPDEVFLIYSPFSFVVNLDNVFTYNFFVKPFYNDYFIKSISPLAKTQVLKLPFVSLSREPYVLTSDWRPDFKSKHLNSYNFISPISLQYLERLKIICQKNKIKFNIIAGPQRQSNKKEIEKFNLLEYKNNKAEEELNFMMSNLKYYPDSIFRDKVHLKKHIAKDFISFMLKEMNTSRNRNTF